MWLPPSEPCRKALIDGGGRAQGLFEAGEDAVVTEMGQDLRVDLEQGQTLVLEKVASLYTSRDHAVSECGLEARKSMARAGRFDAVMA